MRSCLAFQYRLALKAHVEVTKKKREFIWESRISELMQT